MTPEVPIEGHILHAEAYPRDEDVMTFHLLYSEFPGDGSYVGRQFQVGKDVAESLAKQIPRILAEPDTQTAWENTAVDIHEGDHEG
jgi:hypothetical protein